MSNIVDKVTFILAIIAVFIYIVVGIYSLFRIDKTSRNSIKYDCRLAEISVDYPQQVKEQCRRLMKPRVSGVL
jgi:CHASE3 domain sensor protein